MGKIKLISLLLMIKLIKPDDTYLCDVKIENAGAMREIC